MSSRMEETGGGGNQETGGANNVF